MNMPNKLMKNVKSCSIEFPGFSPMMTAHIDVVYMNWNITIGATTMMLKSLISVVSNLFWSLKSVFIGEKMY